MVGWKAQGYGRLSINHVTAVKAHRFACELLVGPVPVFTHVGVSLEADHLCRVRPCVRPSHIEFVTHKTNLHRGVSPTAQNIKKEICLKGHTFDVANTYHGRKGRTCVTCRTERKRCYRLKYLEAWRAINKVRMRIYRLNNPETCKANRRRYTLNKRHRLYLAWLVEQQAILETAHIGLAA